MTNIKELKPSNTKDKGSRIRTIWSALSPQEFYIKAPSPGAYEDTHGVDISELLKPHTYLNHFLV